MKISTRITVLSACMGGLLACDGTGEPPRTTVLTLEQNLDGGLDNCDPAGNCSSLSNPEQCARLEVSADTQSGGVCERCLAADGTVIREGCEETDVACTVITIPEPDCIVCAHRDGPVVLSTCEPEPPIRCEPRPLLGDPVDNSGPVADCEVCYDDTGSIISDRCGEDCSDVACPQILCDPGFRLVYGPGDCCGSCVPVDNCHEQPCPTFDGVTDCPRGTQLVRDPTDCCGYRCEPIDCSFVDCLHIPIDCAPGYHLDFSYPNCCGVCVPDDPPVDCVSDADCPQGSSCTVSDGDCRPAPGCDPTVGVACPAVCYGVCKPDGSICDPIPLASSSSLPYFECEGEWQDGGYDAEGCPVPPVCICPDGQTSFDGRCHNLCDLVDCFAPPPECDPDQELSLDYPHCCGICISREAKQCEATGGSWDEASCGHYNCGEPPSCEALIPGCNCGPGANFVTGEGCVKDSSCGGGNGCAYEGEVYEDGDIFPAADGCNSCSCLNGEVYCTLMPCYECWGAQRDEISGACLSPNGTDYPGLCCDESRLCQDTGGTWDTTSCGHWNCGEQPLCDAIIPGCNCGFGRSFDPNLGCFDNSECGGGDCLHNGETHAGGESFEAGDGCNTCTCWYGVAICTEIACSPDSNTP